MLLKFLLMAHTHISWSEGGYFTVKMICNHHHTSSDTYTIYYKVLLVFVLGWPVRLNQLGL